MSSLYSEEEFNLLNLTEIDDPDELETIRLEIRYPLEENNLSRYLFHNGFSGEYFILNPDLGNNQGILTSFNKEAGRDLAQNLDPIFLPIGLEMRVIFKEARSEVGNYLPRIDKVFRLNDKQVIDDELVDFGDKQVIKRAGITFKRSRI
jgi:hypothetical protein